MHLTTTDLEKRVSLLKSLPLFAHVSEAELQQLAALFHDVVYPANQMMVQENEIIDSILIIAEGSAEVSCQRKTKKTETDILAVLHAGEAIGLSDTGFFSKTRVRTATVTAVTAVFAIRLELPDLKQFLETHPAILPDMQQTTRDILLHNFIKKVEPFAEVSHELLQSITPHIETLELPPDTIIFRQGDIAECCYLLCEGKVKVILTKANGSEENIAEVEPGELLGEMALLTDNKRNATLKTITACKLFVLRKNEFQQLVQHSTTVGNTLTSLLMDRHRPLRCEGISIHTRQDTAQKTIIILKNAEKGTYVKTTEEGLFVWHQLDGEHTLQDIAVAYFYRFRKLAIESIGALVLQLMRTGFVITPALATYIPQPKLSRWMRALATLRHIMEYEYDLKNVDGWITRLYQNVGYLFFTNTAKILMAFFAIVGFAAFVNFLPHVGVNLKATPHAWLLLVLMGPANILAVPLHELAHALTTKAYGYQVHRLGVGWFWLGPIAFADTSDMWLSTRGPRMAVNLAGIYVNVIISGILALLAWCLPNPTIAVFFWLVALSSYLMAFYNLDPIFELDGYYVLMDALDKPNLRAHAIKWLLQDFKKTITHFTLIRQYFSEILYWIVSILFILFASLIAYVIQTFVFDNILPQKIGNVEPSHYTWIFPVIVIVLSFLSLYAKVKRQAYLFHK